MNDFDRHLSGCGQQYMAYKQILGRLWRMSSGMQHESLSSPTETNSSIKCFVRRDEKIGNQQTTMDYFFSADTTIQIEN